MKTVKDIDDLIKAETNRTNTELTFIKNDETKIKALKNRYGKRVTFLRQVKSYLESSPKEETLIRDRDKLEDIIESRKKNYKYWAESNKNEKKPEKAFNKQFIKPLMDQVRTLNFIIFPLE